jgi:hypothetical protein
MRGDVKMITQELLQSLFEYHEDGYFIRKKNGKKVISSPTKGQKYLRVLVDGKPRQLHRMIFLHQNGYLPKVTDHIDGDSFNNRIENLRSVTQQQNCLNRKHKSNSSSLYKNVYLQPPLKNQNWKRNWVVSLMVNKKRKYIGSFEDVELADLVAQEARDKYHGRYARHF